MSLKEQIKVPMTDDDLMRYLGNDIEVIKYVELEKYQDIREVLPYDKSFQIILIEYFKNTGHWITLLRYNNTIEVFNSFGTKHDEEDFIGSNEINYYLGQSHLFLNILLEKELDRKDSMEIVYNKIKYQIKHDDVNTCGRHVTNRLICMLEYDMNLQEYNKFMKESTKKTNLNYDELVTNIIT